MLGVVGLCVSVPGVERVPGKRAGEAGVADAACAGEVDRGEEDGGRGAARGDGGGMPVGEPVWRG